MTEPSTLRLGAFVVFGAVLFVVGILYMVSWTGAWGVRTTVGLGAITLVAFLLWVASFKLDSRD